MNLTSQKIATIITPLTLLSAFAVLISLYGVIEESRGGRENYGFILYYVGIPTLLIALALHFIIRWCCKKNNRSIWIAEAVFIIVLVFLYYLQQ